MSRLETVLEMLAETPKDAFLIYAAALEYAKRDQIEKAIQYLQDLRREQPDYLGLYYQLGTWLAETDQLDAAAEVFEAGISIAKTQGDRKAQGELNEALMLLDD